MLVSLLNRHLAPIIVVNGRQTRTNTRRLRMTGIMTPAVHLHHFRFGKFQALGFCCTECTITDHNLFYMGNIMKYSILKYEQSLQISLSQLNIDC
jgi:hypothetical protein